MSAIGNYYVHYYARNYKREGIDNIEGHGFGIAPTQKDLQLQSNYIDSKYNNFDINKRKKEVEDLQEAYQEMLFGVTEKSFEFRKLMEQALNSMLDDAFG